jgi:hypothetical protein
MVGATLEGEEFDGSFAITDAEVVGETPGDVVSCCYTPQGSLAFGPLGPQVSRVAVNVPHPQDDTPPTRGFRDPDVTDSSVRRASIPDTAVEHAERDTAGGGGLGVHVRPPAEPAAQRRVLRGRGDRI